MIRIVTSGVNYAVRMLRLRRGPRRDVPVPPSVEAARRRQRARADQLTGKLTEAEQEWVRDRVTKDMIDDADERRRRINGSWIDRGDG